MFISESRFLTFNLYNLFSLGFLIPCILFLPISTFFLATLSLPRVCFFSLRSKRFAPSLPQVRSRVPTFWSNLRGNARYASYRFSPSCVAGGAFLRVRVLATNPLFSAVCQRKGEAQDRRQI